MDIDTKLAELLELGIGCPRAIQIRGPRVIEDWADEHLTRLELESQEADGETLEMGTESAEDLRFALSELLENVDPIEVMETVANQANELLAVLRVEEDASDRHELLVELVSQLPSPGGFVSWAREVAAETSLPPVTRRVLDSQSGLPLAAPTAEKAPAAPRPKTARKVVYQCQASTKAGKRCQRTIKRGVKFCPTHAKAGKVHKPRV